MLDIRFIERYEIKVFISFLRGIAEWLNKTGKGMWSIEKLERELFLKNNKSSDCYLGFVDDIPAASIILKESDPFMWPGIKKDETIFIGKLGVERKYSGRGLAKEMLDFARQEAVSRDKKYLRLDCYADREYLCRLYEEYGFKLIERS